MLNILNRWCDNNDVHHVLCCRFAPDEVTTWLGISQAEMFITSQVSRDNVPPLSHSTSGAYQMASNLSSSSANYFLIVIIIFEINRIISCVFPEGSQYG